MICIFEVHFQNNRIFSSSLNGSVRVWDIDSGSCLHVLDGLFMKGTLLQYVDSNTLVTLGYEGQIKTLDTENG